MLRLIRRKRLAYRPDRIAVSSKRCHCQFENRLNSTTGFSKFDCRVFTQREHAGFAVEFKPIAPGLFAIGFHFEVETVEIINSIEFFFRLSSAAVRIGEYNGALFIYYTVIVLT